MPDGSQLTMLKIIPQFEEGTLSIRRFRENRGTHTEYPFKLNKFVTTQNVEHVKPLDPGDPLAVFQAKFRNFDDKSLTFNFSDPLPLSRIPPIKNIFFIIILWYIFWQITIFMVYYAVLNLIRERYDSIATSFTRFLIYTSSVNEPTFYLQGKQFFRQLSLKYSRFLSIVATLVLAMYVCGLLYPPYAPDIFIHWNAFNVSGSHRATAFALLQGHLDFQYPIAKYGVDGDLQLYNGGVYTNWGYGIPLLQLPFNVLWRAISSASSTSKSFFPDAWIFFFYLGTVTVLFNVALSKLLITKTNFPNRGHKHIDLSGPSADWLAMIFVNVTLIFSLYWLIVLRFAVYEETICFFILAQLYAIVFLIFYAIDGNSKWAAGIAIASGFGLLIRPTGIFYIPLWALCVYRTKADRRALLYFSSVILLFLIFWCWQNYIRAGSILASGIRNPIANGSGQPKYVGNLKFPDYCAFTEKINFFWDLFLAFFSPFGGGGASSGHATYCGTVIISEFPPYSSTPFVSLWTATILAIILISRIRKNIRFHLIAPFFVLLAFFFAFSYAGAFTHRYIGDFVPAVVLIGVQLLIAPPGNITPGKLVVVAILSSIMAFYYFNKNINSARDTLVWRSQKFDPVSDFMDLDHGTNGKRFLSTWNEMDRSVWPTVRECRSVIKNMLEEGGDRLGWEDDCTIKGVTQIYMSIPNTQIREHTLKFDTNEVLKETVAVYVNGRIVEARWYGNQYQALFKINPESMKSPNVAVAILWSKPGDIFEKKVESEILLKRVEIE